MRGPRGEVGPKGDQGVQGIQGIQGPQGIPGIGNVSRCEHKIMSGMTKVDQKSPASTRAIVWYNEPKV